MVKMHRVYVFSTILIILNVNYGISQHLSGWGPFEEVHHSIVPCRGPNRVNITSMFLKLDINPENGRGRLHGNNTNAKAGGPLTGRMRIWKWVKNRFEAGLTITSNKCQQFPRIMEFVRKTGLIDARCYLVPGFSPVSLDLSTFGRAIWGDKFFYGRFKYRILVYTPKENVWCYDGQVHFMEPSEVKPFMESFNKTYPQN